MDREYLDYNDSNNKLAGTAALIPGVLMIIMTLGILMADILYSGMDEAQYVVYAAAFRICSIAAALCGIICLRSKIMGSGERPAASTVLLALFAVWMLLSTAVNGLTTEAMKGVPYRYLGVGDYIICLFAYMGCSALIRTDRHRNIILTGYIITADLVAAAALTDKFTDTIAAFDNKTGLSAIFFHENHYGYFLVMAVLISAGYFIYGRGRVAALGTVSMLINLAALGVNQTMGCILAVGGVVILLLIYSLFADRPSLRRIVILTVFLAASAIAAVIASQAVRDDVRQLIFDIGSITWGGNNGLAGHRRWLLWTETISYIKDSPLVGYGCEGMQEMLKDATGVSSPHCEVLTYAAFFGIPAAVLYVSGVIAAFIRSLGDPESSIPRRIALMAACGYFISSLLGVAMFYTLPFFFIFAGISSGRTA